MSDDKAEAQIRRAARAAALMRDDLLVEAFDGLHQAYITAWQTTRADDQRGREALFIAVNVVSKVRDHLQATLDAGKIAQKRINDDLTTPAPKRFGII